MKNLYYLIGLFFIIGSLKALAWEQDNYYGSGRDYSYSQYIDYYYSPEYVPNYPHHIEGAAFVAYINNGPAPVPPPLPAAPLPPPIPVTDATQPPTFVVNIPLKQGGYKPIIIKSIGTGYVGPQGEFYPKFPTIRQLEVIYGNN